MAELNKAKIGGESFDVVPLPAFSVSPPVVVAQPSAAISFSVSGATAGSGLTYQWQLSTNSGKTWQDSTATSAKTATVSTTATAARNGYLYRCVVSYSGKSETSKPGKLIVLS